MSVKLSERSTNPNSSLMLYSVRAVMPSSAAICVHLNPSSLRNSICPAFTTHFGRPGPSPFTLGANVVLPTSAESPHSIFSQRHLISCNYITISQDLKYEIPALYIANMHDVLVCRRQDHITIVDAQENTELSSI